MKLRQLAVAFLFNEEKEVLFLRKKRGSPLFPCYLVPIGGHMESSEINDPQLACLREIKEETGISSKSINQLSLRYVVMRIKQVEEIRIQYVFFGELNDGAAPISSEEGELVWVQLEQAPHEKVSETTREIIEHYRKEGREINCNIYVGTMRDDAGPHMNWSVLEDWEHN